MKDSRITSKNQEANDNIHGKKMDFLRAVRFDRDLTEGQKTVASVLVDHFNFKEGISRPPVDLIAFAAGMTTKTVRRSLSALEGGGWFEGSERRVAGRQRANVYTPNWDRALSLTEMTRRWRAEVDQVQNMDPREHNDNDAASTISTDHNEALPVTGEGYALASGLVIEANQYAMLVDGLGDQLPEFLQSAEKHSLNWPAGSSRALIDVLFDQWTAPF